MLTLGSMAKVAVSLMEVCIINERIIHSNRSYSLIEVLDLDEDEDAQDYGKAGHVAVHSHEVGG